jgi:hypothetical protein
MAMGTRVQHGNFSSRHPVTGAPFLRCGLISASLDLFVVVFLGFRDVLAAVIIKIEDSSDKLRTKQRDSVQHLLLVLRLRGWTQVPRSFCKIFSTLYISGANDVNLPCRICKCARSSCSPRKL